MTKEILLDRLASLVHAFNDDGRKDAVRHLCNDVESFLTTHTQSLEEENKRLREALEDLIFTSSALWDKVKSIKDGPCLRVTHPIIEQAREVLGKSA
jgi:hypothetical protein